MASIRGKLVYQDDRISLYFDLDRAGIVHYALESVELGRNLEDLARATKSYAEAISPYDAKDSPPHYRDQWDHVPYIERRAGDPPFPRQARLVINYSEHAEYVEFGGGNANNPYGHRIFPKLFDFLETRIA